MAAINPPPLIPGMTAPPPLANPPTATDAKLAEEYHLRIAAQRHMHIAGFTDQMYTDSKIYANEVLAAVALNAVPQNAALAGAPLWAQQMHQQSQQQFTQLNARITQLDQNAQQRNQHLQQLNNRINQLNNVFDELKLVVFRTNNLIKSGGGPGNPLDIAPVLDPVVNPANLSAHND
ncbi:hypothetical protein MIND_00030200 [Mycena indigotica]|uniref:Uncharacterized protein n=1 Tax=Mycena indigotica TaxID=2126181 RepID=A0A8H6TCG9_9AGAR|nr:uncharacterized protein MIND_00030200 [Mycena indigotica]KAF7315158.1 hypothetical protein MIND_00030200 [Mycena indigotica]